MTSAWASQSSLDPSFSQGDRRVIEIMSPGFLACSRFENGVYSISTVISSWQSIARHHRLLVSCQLKALALVYGACQAPLCNYHADVCCALLYRAIMFCTRGTHRAVF